jgi:hypothetical protein
MAKSPKRTALFYGEFCCFHFQSPMQTNSPRLRSGNGIRLKRAPRLRSVSARDSRAESRLGYSQRLGARAQSRATYFTFPGICCQGQNSPPPRCSLRLKKNQNENQNEKPITRAHLTSTKFLPSPSFVTRHSPFATKKGSRFPKSLPSLSSG